MKIGSVATLPIQSPTKKIINVKQGERYEYSSLRT
jgi:hypothetical protein